jgi:glycogen(starch) synthase
MTGETGWPITQHAGGIAGAVQPGRQSGDAVRETRPVRYEELPSVLIEAMAAGLPVIPSRVGGIPALVDHDVNGLLVPPGDPAALAAAISRVLTEPGTAARLAAAARQTAQRYTWPALARQVAEVYLQVIGKPRPA